MEKTKEQRAATDKKAQTQPKPKQDGGGDRQRKPEAKGLVKLRAATSEGGPSYQCGNCGCKRYSPCGCKKSDKKLKEQQQ